MSVPSVNREIVKCEEEKESRASNDSKVLSISMELCERNSQFESQVKEEMPEEEYHQIYENIKKENIQDPLASSEYENQFDAKWKKEISDKNHSQLFNSNIEEESFQVINTGSMGNLFVEKKLYTHIQIEEETKYCPVMVDIKTLEFQDVLDDSECNSIHNDVLVAPQKTECKLCHKIFKNSFNLYKHNNEHIKINIETLGNINNKSHRIQCNRSYEEYYKMLSQICVIRNNEESKCELCRKNFINIKELELHTKLVHPIKVISLHDLENEYKSRDHTNLSSPSDKVEVTDKYKCELCEKVYKSKSFLRLHVKRMHCGYGRQFTCWCGEKYSSAARLKQHKCVKHGRGGENEQECVSCKKVFRNKGYLSRHIRRVHYDYGRSFDCFCGKQFRTPSSLKRHISIRHDGGRVADNVECVCESCKKVFRNKRYLKYHLKRMHYDYGKTFDCQCGKHFRTPELLRSHIRLVNCCRKENNDKINGIYQCSSKRFATKKCDVATSQIIKCKLCRRMFENCFELYRHNVQHIHIKVQKLGNNKIDELHNCRYCGKECMDYYRTLAHIIEVHGEKESKCELCAMKFHSLKELDKHIQLIHPMNLLPMQGSNLLNEYKSTKHIDLFSPSDNNKRIKYKCDSCEGVYTSKRSLNEHAKRLHHVYKRLFDCSCGDKFTSPVHLREHKYLKHGRGCEVDGRHECESCKKVFPNKRYLTQHVRRVHYRCGRTFNCWCGRQFRTPSSYSKHKYVSHDRDEETAGCKYECDSCRKAFKNKRNIVYHIKRMHYDYKKTFNCRQCGKEYRTPEHLRSHINLVHCSNGDSGGKYVCDHCDYVFKCKRYLKDHMKRILQRER